MRRFLLIGVVLLTVPLVAQAQAVEDKQLDAAMRDALKAFDAPGAAVVVVRDDKVIYVKGFGVRELGKDDTVTPDTVFQIASCTKAFLAMLIAMLTGEGKMDWDDPVRKHLPYFQLSDPLADRNVTLRDLLCHRTGLSRHDVLWYKAPVGAEEAVRRVGKVKLTTSFRSQWEYANIPFMAAGLSASAAEKRPLSACFRERIFKPLGMTNATARAADFLDIADRSAAHERTAEGKHKVIPPLVIDSSGAGEICASARDLGRWLRFQLAEGVWDGKRLLPAKHFHEMHTPQMVVRLEDPRLRFMFPDYEQSHLTYGLGWFVQNYHGQRMVHHGGTLPGFRTHTVLMPESKFGVAVMTNLSGTYLPEATTRTLVDLCLKLPKKDWNAHFVKAEASLKESREKAEAAKKAKRQPKTTPSRALPEYAGTFSHPAYGDVRVSAAEGELTMHWRSFNIPLEHWHFDTFKLRRNEGFLDNYLVFTLDGDGAVAELRWFGQEFTKAKSPKQ